MHGQHTASIYRIDEETGETYETVLYSARDLIYRLKHSKWKRTGIHYGGRGDLWTKSGRYKTVVCYIPLRAGYDPLVPLSISIKDNNTEKLNNGRL